MKMEKRIPQAPKEPTPELVGFLGHFEARFAKPKRSAVLERYVTGLLTEHPHKNSETLAGVVPGINAAHEIVQQYEDTTAAWIHAVLHKIEGDEDNSRYWYRRAGKLEHFPDEPKAELAEIRKRVAGEG